MSIKTKIVHRMHWTPSNQMERLERRLTKHGVHQDGDKYSVSCPGRRRHIVKQMDRIEQLIYNKRYDS